MENEPKPETATSSEPTLRSAQAVQHFASLAPGQAARADLRGVIVARRKTRSALFFDLSDTSQSLQLIVSLESAPPPLAETAALLQVADRVRATGQVTVTERGILSIAVDHLEVLIPRRALSDSDLVADLRKGDISPRFLLARLGRVALDFFEKKDFVFLSPHYISTSISQSALEPLDVVFPGWGATTSLVPSPLPQLLEAAVISGSPQVAALCRIFSRTIRDGFTSAEALTLCAVTLETDENSLIQLSAEAVTRILDQFITAATGRRYLEPDKWKTLDSATTGTSIAVETPTRIIYRPRRRGESGLIFKILWPPDLSIVEGHLASVSKVVPYGAVSIHLERMVRLLLGTSLRRIRYYGPDVDGGES